MARPQCDTRLVRVSFCFQKSLHSFSISIIYDVLSLSVSHDQNILCHFDHTKNFLFPKHVISKEVEKLPQVWSKHWLQKTLIGGKLKLKACWQKLGYLLTTTQDCTGTNSVQGVHTNYWLTLSLCTKFIVDFACSNAEVGGGGF
jgi:3-hydroxymyristoyl/3-hydroxydecanoyl-(acyl carrier protein) dehydratase